MFEGWNLKKVVGMTGFFHENDQSYFGPPIGFYPSIGAFWGGLSEHWNFFCQVCF